MKKKKRGARILSLALSAVMVFTMVPVSALATTMPTLGTGNVCTHKHDENCGYAEATVGVDCTHTGENACGTQIERQEEISCDKACTETNDAGEIKHAEDCAYSPAVEGRDPVACNHTDDCGYVPAVDGSDCVHVCDVACGGIEQPVQPPVCVKTEGCTLLDEHEGECSLNEIEDDCICNSEVGTHTNEACAFYVAHSFTGVKSGTCGGEGNEENVTWALTQNNEDTENPTFTLTIAGTGAMADYIGWNKAPWCTAITGAATDKNSITALIIEEGITEIGAYAFVGHANIPEIILPNSVVEVHGNAFNNCTAVTTIEWSSNLKTIGACAFQYLTGYTGSLVLPQGLNEIGLGAFGEGKYSGNLNIPGSVIHIGTSAFSNNTGLNGTLTLEEGVKTIGDSAFNGCKFIGNLTIPNSVTAIGERTFSSKFTGALKIGNQVETIGKQAFYGTGFTGELIIPDSVDTIGDSAFDNNGFSVIQVEGSVDSIGDSAFINSTSTHSLDLSSVSENVILGGSAFKSLKNPNIIYLNSAGMTSTIEDVITENRSSFAITNGGVFEKNGIFEEGVLAVPSKDGYIFGGWYDNAGFTGEKVTAAEVGKTYYAKWIDDTEIAKSGTCGAEGNEENVNWELTTGGHLTISGSGETANYTYPVYTPWYSERGEITSVTISDGITRLGDNLLNGLNIKKAEIPRDVVSIGDALFSGCMALTNISVSSNNTAFIAQNDVLFNMQMTALVGYPAGKTDTSYTVPRSVTEIYPNAFAWNAYLEEVILPNNGDYEVINGNMFYRCTALKSITIPEGVTGMESNAFAFCSALEHVSIPSTMVTFNSTFGSLTALKTIEFAADSTLTSIPDNFAVNCTSLQSIELPVGIERIGNKAFMGSGLQTLTFAGDGVSSLTTIGQNAFNNNYGQSGNTDLANLEWDAMTNLQSIGADAFRKCIAMAPIPFDKLTKLSQIDASAFRSCTGVPASLQLYGISSLGNEAFLEQPRIHSVNLTLVPDDIVFGTQIWHDSTNNPVLFYLPNTTVSSSLKAVGQRGSHVNAITDGGIFEDDTTFEAGKLATPTKEGYTFAGWYENAEFTGDAVSIATAGKTYYAKWSEASIIFDSKTDGNAIIYDGTQKTLTATLENTPAATFTYTYALRTSADGEGSYGETSSTAPSDAGYYKVVATLSGSNRTATAYLEIKPGTITATVKNVEVQQGDTTTQQVALNSLELTPNLATIGVVTYTIQSTQDTNSILDGMATIADEKLQFKLKEIVDAQHNASILVTVTPASKNYNPVVATVTVEITKDTVAPTMTAKPVSGADTIIGTAEQIMVSFSKKMMGTPTVSVSGDTATAQAVLAQDGLSMTITPSNLVKSTTYNFTVSGLTDVAGNVLTSNVLTYTTIQAAEPRGTAVPTITGDTTIIDGNPDALPENISVDYTAQVTTSEKNTLSTASNLPNGFSKTTVFFELALLVEEMVIEDPVLNREIMITVPFEVTSNTQYKIAHLKSDGSVEILDATADSAKKTLSFSVSSMSPFMVLSKYTAPSSGGVSGSSYDYYDIKISKEGKGTISPDNRNNKVTVREQTDQTFTFTPDKGYAISDVLVDGKSVGVNATYKFENVTKNHTLKVVFKASEEAEKPQTGVDFEDVRENDWFYEAVQKTVENGWFAGTSDTTFDPDLSTTRGMIATILWRMEGSPKTTGSSSFDDVEVDEWYYDGITWAEKNDIVGGYGDGNYGPNDNITREQLVAILYRYAQFKGYDVSKTGSFDRFIDKDASSEYTYFKSYDKIKNVTLESFTDGGSTSAYAKIAMDWAVVNGLISGRGNNTLAPTASATRAEVATILVRFETLFSKE